MEQRDPRPPEREHPPERAHPPEPSWPTVIATTLRLWLERHPVVIDGHQIRIWSETDRGAGLLSGRRVAVLALVAGLLVVGAGATGVLLNRRPAAAQWGSAAAVGAPVGPIAGLGSAPGDKVPAPATLTIPAIGVRTSLIDLGLTADGALQVPPSTAVAGWYTGSPRPGAVGPAVIAGHIDSAVGPGVFFRLSRLRPGDPVYVRRTDGTLAVFRVTIVRSYAKDRFPTLAVYGPVPDAELRLITCGGTFDWQTRSYLSNTVVYAAQVGAGSR